MTVYTLVPHPNQLPHGVTGVSVSIERGEGRCVLVYRVEGAQALKFADPAASERRDELWRTTCFELFAGQPGDTSYMEFNLSPSRAWAAYAFDEHRTGMRDLPIDEAPVIATKLDADLFELRATISLPSTNKLECALTAVIEEVGGTRSLWAARHPDGAADFHDRDCFVVTLPAPDRP